MQFARWFPMGLGVLVLCAAFVLAGCAPQSAPTPSPSSTATGAATDAPVFASDEEALAAATEAYTAYLAASDASWADPPAPRENFLALSVGSAHDGDLSASRLFDEKGWRKTGTTSFDSIRVQSVNQGGDGEAEIRTYLCLDVSKSDVVDVSGISVADVDRPLRLPLEVAFRVGPARGESLLISESQVWSGTNFC